MANKLRYEQAKEFEENIRYFIYDESGYVVGDAFANEKYARLFSASPSLLKACEMALNFIEMTGDDPALGDLTIKPFLRAVIAEAKGNH